MCSRPAMATTITVPSGSTHNCRQSFPVNRSHKSVDVVRGRVVAERNDSRVVHLPESALFATHSLNELIQTVSVDHCYPPYARVFHVCFRGTLVRIECRENAV